VREADLLEPLSSDYLLRRRDEELEQATVANSSTERLAHEALARAFADSAERLSVTDESRRPPAS
jgi:hypothetical protein